MIRSGTARLLTVTEGTPDSGAAPIALFGAQLLGQGGARRGLRGGEPVLRDARAAYLSTQWRGDDDRRPAAGLLRRLSA